MRLLILGESESAGMALRDPSQSWGNQLPGRLGARIDEPVECHMIRYYPWAKGHLDYLEEALDHGPFDGVCCSVTKVGFTVYSADNRLRKVIGNRAADWFKGGVKAVDQRSLWQHDESFKKKAARKVHAAGRKVIGQAPSTSPGAVVAGYRETFARLARLEDVHVVVLNTSNVSNAFVERHPELARLVPEFQARIAAAAQERRLECLDRNELLRAPSGDAEGEFRDGIHRLSSAHDRLSEALAEVFARERTSSRS